MTSQSLATLAWANHWAPYEPRDSGTVKVACDIVYFRSAVLYNLAEMSGSNAARSDDDQLSVAQLAISK